MKKSALISLIKEVLQENNSLTEEKILIPRRTPEERRKNFIKATQQKIQQYIKNGSKGDLDLRNTPITKLPDSLKRVGGDLDLYNTPITSLPDNLTRVGGSLYLGFTPITTLPDNLIVNRSLWLRNTPITSLPDNLKHVGGYLDLSNTKITTLPDNLTVRGNVSLNNTKITKLPDNLTVGGDLSLDYTKITTLPDNLIVGGYLSLRNTSITSLPDNLTVNGSLYLYNTKITSIPKSAKIKGKIIGLKNESIMKKEELVQVIKEVYQQLLSESTRSRVGILNSDGTIKSVYVHNDGYLSGVGKTLKQNYTNDEKIKQLIALGNLSFIGKEIGEKHDFDSEDYESTLAYGRDGGEKNQFANISNTIKEFEDLATDTHVDYTYLWDVENKKWVFKKINSTTKNFQEL